MKPSSNEVVKVNSHIPQNAELLFEMLDNHLERQAGAATNSRHVYFDTVREEENLQKIEATRTFTLVPTGARRQESHLITERGMFTQAQYRLTELGEDEGRYIWCRTRPSLATEPAILDDVMLQRDHSLTELTSENVLETLAADAVDHIDTMQLLEVMVARGLGTTPGLLKRTRQLGYALIGGIRESVAAARANNEVPEIMQNELFEVIRFLQKRNPSEASMLQSQTVTSLLSSFPRGYGRPEVKTSAYVKYLQSLDILVAGLQEGVILHNDATLSRIFDQPASYRDPYIVALLREKLTSEEHSTRPINFMGSNREITAHTFMFSTLRCRLDALREQGRDSDNIKAAELLLARSHTQTYIKPPIKFGKLFGLAKHFGYNTDKFEQTGGAIRLDVFQELPDLFGHVLQTLEAENPSDELKQQNEKAIEMVQIIFEPRVKHVIKLRSDAEERAAKKAAEEKAEAAAKAAARAAILAGVELEVDEVAIDNQTLLKPTN